MKCALPGMYGRKVIINYNALSNSYLEITKESLLPDYKDDFHKVLEERKKSRNDVVDALSYYFYYGRSSGKYRKSFEELKQELLQKDKEENE